MYLFHTLCVFPRINLIYLIIHMSSTKRFFILKNITASLLSSYPYDNFSLQKPPWRWFTLTNRTLKRNCTKNSFLYVTHLGLKNTIVMTEVILEEVILNRNWPKRYFDPGVTKNLVIKKFGSHRTMICRLKKFYPCFTARMNLKIFYDLSKNFGRTFLKPYSWIWFD